MHFTLKSKQTDDPHDFVVVAPDAVRVAPEDDELSKLLHEAAARYRSDPQTHAGSDFPAGAAIPPVDTTFRPAAANDVLVTGHRRSMGRGVVRVFTALLLAACVGLAAVGWRSYGDTVKKQIARLTTQFVLTSSLPPEEPGLPAQPAAPAVQAAVADAAPSQPAPLAQTAAEAVAPTAAAPSAESAQLLESMARDLATAGQEIEQLKASIEQLKASQQQMSRDIAKASEVKASEARASEVKASEQNPRPRISAPQPRSAAARPRKPTPPLPPPQAAAAPMLPQAAAPYVPPRQPEPQPLATAQPQAEPESVLRPPMPLR